MLSLQHQLQFNVKIFGNKCCSWKEGPLYHDKPESMVVILPETSLKEKQFNPLHNGGLFHRYTLDVSICHFRSVWSNLSLLCYFKWKILLSNNVDPDQMPHHMASNLGLHCLPMTLLLVSR